MKQYVIGLSELGQGDINKVGGKNASLGEMIAKLSASGVSVPGGFATTTDAYYDFISQSDLADKIEQQLQLIDIENVAQLNAASSTIQSLIKQASFPVDVEIAIREAFEAMQDEHTDQLAVAVRSSATAEDLDDASFAGQQETFLNVRGVEAVLTKIREVYASLYNARAIAYRVHKGFSETHIAISAGVQKMVRSDLAASGVMFTLDTESGFREAVFVTGNYGLGETVVQGSANPDEFYVYKPALKNQRPAIVRRELGSKAIRMTYNDQDQQGVQVQEVAPEDSAHFCITDDEVTQLATMAVIIETHYGKPMDIEWAKDGIDGQLYIVQARPETVQSLSGRVMTQFVLGERGDVLATGRSIGQGIGAGKARVIKNLDEMDQLQEGEVLITDMTDPDWEPVMKRASAIVTNRGGRTCHAAIIARELGVPAVVGCGDATEKLADADQLTVSCAEGDTGFIYAGKLAFSVEKIHLDEMPAKPVKIMMNVGNPDRAFSFAAIPNDGVGLARLEFIINRMIGIHPQALLEFDQLSPDLQAEISKRISAYGDPVEFYESKLVEGISSIAAAFYPKPVIVRMSDFKSNEYANLLGGEQYEPDEENPMLGFRGASRYVADQFKPCFEMECRALRYVREEMGLRNVQIMVPFVRQVKEAQAVSELLKENGLLRGENDLKIIMMCEIPSNALLADEFLHYFDGFSIGSNDMTQLTLGMDRDSGLISENFDERDPAVKTLLSLAITACIKANKYIGICGQGPSDHTDFAQWLIEQGIESVSLNPDTVVETWLASSEIQPHQVETRRA